MGGADQATEWKLRIEQLEPVRLESVMKVQLPMPSYLIRLLLTVVFATVLPSPIKAAEHTFKPSVYTGSSSQHPEAVPTSPAP
jgi:hypothetical protein